MISSFLNSQFVLIDAVSATDSQSSQFGQNIQWIGTDLFAITSNLALPWISNDIVFSDGAYFDGGGTQFGQLFTSGSQKIDLFQVLTTKRSWINSTDDILKPVSVKTFLGNGDNTAQLVYAGDINNFFLSDIGNPQEAIKIFNNSQLSHGWTVFTAQQSQIDPGSISQAWIYDSVTRTKLADLEVVDLYAGVLPGTIASQLDFVCDIDPACYNITLWGPGVVYNIGDRVLYGGQVYQALYAGKSGTVFNSALWQLITAQSTFNSEGITKWGSKQIGRTWFKTTNLKAINAQLGNLTERSQNWNSWFPNAVIEIFEWVNSITPPSSYISNDMNGFVVDSNCAFTYDSNTKMYGFWVYAKNSLGPIHNQTAAQLIVDISDIPGSGIPMISVIDTNAVAVWNINQFVSANTVVLHIDYVIESANNQLHNEFALISNDGSKSWYKTAIYPKLVDSISGVSSINQLVPDYTIPLSQQTGILNNPVQSLFVNRVTALDIYFSVINEQLANLAVATTAVITALSDADPLPTTGFDEQIPNRTVLNELDPTIFPENYRILLTIDDTLYPPAWSIVSNVNQSWQLAQNQLYNLANDWKYADWFATDYTSATPTYILDSIGDLSQIIYVAGDIIEINDNGSGNKVIFLAKINDIDPSVTELDPIYLQNGTIQFLPSFYDFINSGMGFDNSGFDSQPFDKDPYIDIRLITQILNDSVFVGRNSLTAAADNSFYAILKYIFFENENLDWLFKTSFVTVDYNNRNLDIQGNFEPDNQAVIEDFISETLPFHTRVREFRDTYSSNDYGNIGSVDFDLPSQYDSSYATIVYDYTANPKLNAQLPLNQFTANVGVMIDTRSFYIYSTGIPVANANVSSQNWKFGMPLYPVADSITFDTATNNIGPIAVAIDGVPFFGPNSGNHETLYEYGNISNPLANVNVQQTFTINTVWEAEAADEDPGQGLTNSAGLFGYYANPDLIYTANASIHSPILGYAWDGVPIYGLYGYANPDGSGGIIENSSSYQLSSTPRLDKTGYQFVNGLQLANYALPTGEYIEDFIYVSNSGTLDENNGRFCVTPDYPNGTYAYFVTTTYPYVIGPSYWAKPFGLQYTYINGINTPLYPNGNITIPNIPTIDTVDLIRSPDGTVSSDSTTLQLPIYSPWNDNHLYSIEDIQINSYGAGYLNLNSNVIINPSNNAAAQVSGLRVVGANLVTAGKNYSPNDILFLEGGTYVNSALVQVTAVNVTLSNAISGFTLINVPNQQYTVIPSSPVNVSIVNNTSYGNSATFNLTFGIENIQITENGNNFATTPSVTVTDVYATQAASVYPILGNDLTRKISTTLRFDRVSPTVEYLSANISYPIGSVVYDVSSNKFIQAMVNNANSTSIGNANVWINASDVVVDLSTAVNRIKSSYISTSNTYANQARLLMNGVDYPGVVVSNEQFLVSYPIPTGSIFDIVEPNSGNISLNISWRPQLINDTSLSREYSYFGNSSCVFNAGNDQYIVANVSSPDISTLSINANSFTLEFFMNFSNLSSNLSVMVDTRANVSSTTGLVIYQNNGNICFGSNTNVALISSGEFPIIVSDWRYITLNGNADNLYGYIDGQLIGTASVGYNFADAALTLGADVTGGNVATGYMDEIRLTTNYNRYTPGVINITVPTQTFPDTIAADPYFIPQYTPLLWGFENFDNEALTNITFESINAQTLISDLSWNQKKLQLVNFGANVVIDGSTLNNITNPQTSEILSLKLNQG